MAPPGGDILREDARAKLMAHFKGRENEPGAWDELWKDNNFLPWDREIPNPALVDILNDRLDLTGGSFDGKRRKKALVPGCGKGYDCLLLASHGFDAYGLEGSKHAIEEAMRWQKEHEKDYQVRNDAAGRGHVKFVYGDFFKNHWEKEVQGLRDGSQGGFDLIYDYTFLSALPPETRPAWALQMSNLLNKTGILICIEFPTYKEPKTNGPPWALPPEVYEAALTRPGEDAQNDAEGYVSKEYLESIREAPNEKGLVRIAHWQPERTHEIGKGTDWVSVWKHQA